MSGSDAHAVRDISWVAHRNGGYANVLDLVEICGGVREPGDAPLWRFADGSILEVSTWPSGGFRARAFRDIGDYKPAEPQR